MLWTWMVRAAILAALVAGVLGAQSRLAPEPDVLPGLELTGLTAEAQASQKTTFTISGSVSGLFPGARSQLPLTLANTSRRDIEVTAVRATVADAGPGCSSTTLSITPFRGSVIVKAGGTASVSLAVTMSSDAPDACQGATYPLTYQGDARPAVKR